MGLAYFFMTLLGLSIIGLVSLLLIKRYEMVSGRVFLGRLRPQIGRFFHILLHFVEGALPSFLRRKLEELYAWGKEFMHLGVARSLVALEASLERVLRGLRHTTTPPLNASREASAFLREVSEHKKKLLHRRVGAEN